MRIDHVEYLINSGEFATNFAPDIVLEIRAAIESVVWPAGRQGFVLRPERKGNGVVPIKHAFVRHLLGLGWRAEQRINIGTTLRVPGPIDVVKYVDNVPAVAVEWETGNISSSHRALNKMYLALAGGHIKAAFLVLPTSLLYPYLTDRVGNYDEIAPYFPVWRDRHEVSGVLGVFAVEHDGLSPDVPRIPKGTDGRARR